MNAWARHTCGVWAPLRGLAVLVAIHTAQGQALTNLGSLLSKYAIEAGLDDSVALYHLSVDLDGDGTDEVLVSDTTSENGKAGNIWTVYQNQPGGYSELDGYMELQTDTIAIGRPEGTGQMAIASYHPKSAEAGRLHGYMLEGSAIREIDWGEVRPSQPLEATYEQLFETSTSIPVESIEVGELKRLNREIAAARILKPRHSDDSEGTARSPASGPGGSSVPTDETTRGDDSDRGLPPQSSGRDSGLTDESFVAGEPSALAESITSQWLLSVMAFIACLTLALFGYGMCHSRKSKTIRPHATPRVEQTGCRLLTTHACTRNSKFECR